MDTVLERTSYAYAVEYTSDKEGQEHGYMFFDGAGCMSRRFAIEIAKEMQLGDYVPS